MSASSSLPTLSDTTFHKGALYIGMARVGQFRGNRPSIRNPSSRKGTYGQNMGFLKI